MRRLGVNALAGAALLTLGLGVGACGGGGPSASNGTLPNVPGSRAASSSAGGPDAVSIDTLRLAASHTEDASSYAFTTTMSMTVAGKRISVDASGSAAGDGKQLQATVAMAGIGSFEERLVDNALYIDFGAIPEATSELPDGKRWLAIDFDEIQSQTGVDFGQLLDQAQQSSPTQGLQYLQGLSGDVEQVGDDTVNGEHAVHYRASIDYASLGDNLGLSDAAKQKLASLGTVPIDVWLDDQGRVVKMQFAIDGSAVGQASAGTVEMTMELHGFGVPVDVQAPPPDETFTYDEMLGT